MTRRPRLLRHVVPVVVALGLATGVVLVLPDAGSAEERREELYAVTSDRVADAVAGLRDDHVHVSPDGRPLLPAAAEAAISEEIVARDLPVYVVVWEPSRFAGYDHPIHALEQLSWALGRETGGPVAVVLWQGPDDGYLDATPGYRWDPDVDYEAAEPEYLGEAGRRIPEWLAGLPDDGLFDELEVVGAAQGVTDGALAGLAVTAAVAVVVVPGRLLLQRRRRHSA